MRIRDRLIVATTLVAALLALPAGPALADPSGTFGSHVRNCAQTMGINGTHNPGMYGGATGWDGEPCQ